MPRPAPANALQALAPAPPARLWMALAAMSVLLSLGVAWSLSGTVPITVAGDGVIVAGEMPVSVTAPAHGRVAKLHRAVGDRVSAGELIAEVDAPEARLQLTEMQGLLTALQQSDRNLQAEEQRSIAAVVNAMAHPGGTAPLSEAQALDRLDELLAARASRAAEIERASATVRRLVQAQEEMTQVRAPVAGTVISIGAAEGGAVERGATLVDVAPTPADGRTRCIATIRGADPGRVAEGMAVRLIPDVARPEVHGYVLGTVERVMRSQDGRAPDMAIILIGQDPDAPSGMAWVGGRGLPDRLAPVSRAEIAVTVDEVAPITLAMPWLARQ